MLNLFFCIKSIKNNNKKSRTQGLVECFNFRPAGIAKQKSKDEQDQENPNDFRDPSVEAKERLLAVDKDEEEEDEETDLKIAFSGVEISSRKLICVEEASNVIMLLYYINPINPIITFFVSNRPQVSMLY